MYKAGIVAEWRNLGLRRKIPDEVYREAEGIVIMLDNTFEAERDVDFEDGMGGIVIAQTREELDHFARDYVALDSPTLEYVEPVPSAKELYLSAFFLVNEYAQGISLFVPASLAPKILLKGVQNREEHAI